MKKRPIVAGVGEILWDVFPDGPRFGGAPANFACAVAELAGARTEVTGAEVFMVSAVGSDELGTRALAALGAHGVNTRCVASLPQATGQVLVELDEENRASYVFAADAAWDNLAWSHELQNLAERTDAVCFGTLGQRSEISRHTIRQFVRAMRPESWRVLDINLRPPYWNAQNLHESLPLANVLKLNDTELPILAEVLGLPGTERQQLQRLRDEHSFRAVALTRGPAGAVLLNAAGEYSDLPSQPTTVIDTVGAGDAFTAAIVLGLLDGLPLDTINAWAARVAAFVCSQPGATPHFPQPLRAP